MTHVKRSAGPTPATVVLVNQDGARALLHRPGASQDASADALELTPEQIDGCGWFHLANVFALPVLRPRAGGLVMRARQAGMSVSIDTGWDARGEWLGVRGRCLPHADLLFVNEDEPRELTGRSDPLEAARALQERGARARPVQRRSGALRQTPSVHSTCKSSGAPPVCWVTKKLWRGRIVDSPIFPEADTAMIGFRTYSVEDKCSSLVESDML